jgi:hypothetical protein
MGIKEILFRNLSNLPGWRTKRKIVVFESDDWGSIRMSSKSAFDELLNYGIPVDKCHFNLNDSLESNDDLTSLLEVLYSKKNALGYSPIFTNVAIVGNPDFERIVKSNYQEYCFESTQASLKKYPHHDQVETITRQGIDESLIYPIFHGREHLNVKRWLKYLKEGNADFRFAFKFGVTGIANGKNGVRYKDVQAAFDIDHIDDTKYLASVIASGLNLFEQQYGFKARYFVPTNGPFNNDLEANLYKGGIQYVNTAKKQLEPIGNNKFKKNIRYLGKKNQFGQYYITRNCFFEPASNEKKNWVDSCLKEIEIAFRWNKPAIISTHRVNYIGFIREENRKFGLSQLNELLNQIIKRYPDVEFMTSVQLGDLIVGKEK